MPKEEKECIYCGTVFMAWPCNNRKFCSKKCSNRNTAQKRKTHIYIRLFQNINIRPPFTCWEFTGTRDNYGYGKLSNRNGRGHSPEKAHRIMYEIVYGDMPNKKPFVLHKCDNPKCVNPDHLYAGDQYDNMQDASRRNRLNPKSLDNLIMGDNKYTKKYRKNHE